MACNIPSLLSLMATVAVSGLTPPHAAPDIRPMAAIAVPVTPTPQSAVQAPAAAPTDPASADQPAEDSRIARSEDGMFYATALVNGARVRFLVDTGANIVLLTPDAARRAGVRIRATTMMRTASGGAPLALATIEHVQLGGQSLHGIEAGVVRSGLPISLLGQSALMQMRGIRIEGDTLHLL